MSDNHRRYRSIRTALSQLYFKEPEGYSAKQLNVLAALISGIVSSRRTNYPQIASKVPDHTQLESRVKRFSRFINEVTEQQEIHLMPFAADLLRNLANFTLVLIMDGSDVGRGCVALMLSVQYRGRALPLGWLVVSGEKGHFSQEKHIRLLSAIETLLPSNADLVFFGDGDFDGYNCRKHWTNLAGNTPVVPPATRFCSMAKNFPFRTYSSNLACAWASKKYLLRGNATVRSWLWPGGAWTIRSQFTWSPTWT